MKPPKIEKTKNRDPFSLAVCALGITQITAWGASYYCLGILAGPIAADTGWSLGAVYFGFTVALIAMAIVSTHVGRLLDRHGGQKVMTLGALLVSVGLYALSLVQSEAAYFAVWAFLGVAMRLCLYDAAFASLVQVLPSRGRLAISALTLFGAFASTVFWPLGHYFEANVGWRTTLVLFAAINLAICLPLNWFGLARREAPRAAAERAGGSAAPAEPPLEGQARKVGIALFALIMSVNGFVFAVTTVQLVPLLQAAGLGAVAAVWVASMKGFAQFGGRVVEIMFGRRLRPITVARIAIGLLPISFVLLLAGGGTMASILAFTLLMGASQGVISIVRGALPLAMFGAAGYGAVLGLVATPITIVGAASPTLFALTVDRWGWHASEILLIICAAVSWIAMEGMARWVDRNRRRVSASIGSEEAR